MQKWHSHSKLGIAISTFQASGIAFLCHSIEFICMEHQRGMQAEKQPDAATMVALHGVTAHNSILISCTSNAKVAAGDTRDKSVCERRHCEPT